MGKSETKFSGTRLERIKASAQFDGKRFQNANTASAELKGNPLPVMGEYFFGGGKRVPPSALPLEKPIESWGKAIDSDLRMTWLGHSTLMMEIGGRRILTDPVFGERASPVNFAGPKRFHPVPVPLSELPPLDAVLLSHDHYDHLCRWTMKELIGHSVPIITSLGVGQRLEVMGIEAERIIELDWGESHDIDGVRLTATPAQHFSGRGVADRNLTLWSSWVIQSDKAKVFFSGDTGLTSQFEQIGKSYGPFDLVLLEVGAWHESWGDIHLGPANALQVFEMLGGGTLLPVHWGTFNLALHDWDEPAETLVRLAGESGQRVITPRLGQVFVPERLESPDLWWREVR